MQEHPTAPYIVKQLFEKTNMLTFYFDLGPSQMCNTCHHRYCNCLTRQTWEDQPLMVTCTQDELSQLRAQEYEGN